MQQSNEYWVNVYENHALGGHYNLDIAKFKSRTEDMKTIYRIHVKMKPVEDKEIVVEELWQVPKDLPIGTKVRITGPKIYSW